jgi:hypothetical protein
VDTGGTQASGFQWYLNNAFGQVTPSSVAVFNAGGTVTLTGTPTNYQAQFSSVTVKSASPYFVGTAFGCGGYFTAEIAFNPAQVNTANGWPAWWSMSVEVVVNQPSTVQWTGQPTGYAHFSEVDFFEKDGASYPAQYDSTVWDTSGIYGVTCGGAWCQFGSGSEAPGPVDIVTPKTDFTLYHRIAALWVPATSTTSGYIKFYFDDVLVNSGVSWTQYVAASDAPPITTATPWAFGVLDTQHLVLFLGTGNSPISVRSVDVWQGSGACNITY